ncbi:uncharacterized protein LAJ45_03457 [Morchella importuna]|uniref:uncharacterized protein n=1 Tax=Morchella importuna TaxID=1174673 RepID=UPI001E8DFA2C|nr:uncharacterized protein LAJ45_03457 [Morchella importuna]KAH8152616.1 hypothetical protein LAJ45_03457 [Morchella importuna]
MSDTTPPPAKRVKLGVTAVADAAELQTESSVLVSIPPPPTEKKAEEEVEGEDGSVSRTEAVSQVELERAVGITEYVDAGIRGWSGVLKQRYTDFLVNEIDEEGNVAHLTKLTVDGHENENENENEKPRLAPAAPPAPHIPEPASAAAAAAASKAAKAAQAAAFELSADDFTALSSLTTPELATACVSLYRAILSAPTPVELPTTTLTTPAIAAKEARSTLHALVRRLFSSKLETTTLTGDDNDENKITIKPAPAAGSSRGPRQRRGNRGGARQKAPATKAADRGGDYCHFLLYKENKDTMHAVKIVQKLLGLRGGAHGQIGFAGTKDKRAVTVQRCSVYRVDASRLARLNTEGAAGALHAGTRVGNFGYKTYGLELGDLGGNEFVITLRECAVAAGETRPLKEVVEEVVERVREGGFVNYFGLQRFGSYTVGTWEVGVKLLCGDWHGAVGQILHYDPALLPSDSSADSDSAENTNTNNNNRDDIARATAIAAFNAGDHAKAANLIPYKYSAESAILHYFAARPASTDYCAALGTIPRALKTMYVHALQSYVWNHVASARVRMGLQVLPGDLVLIPLDSDADAPPAPATEDIEVDQNGEVVVHAPTASATGRRAPGAFQRARALSAAEAASGQWGIRDIVLPTPGWDVVYPSNELLEVYQRVMAPHGLDPLEMKRGVREFSLPGSYRGAVAGFLGGRCSVEVRGCRGVEQVVKTDLEVLVAGEKGGKEEKEDAAATAGDGEEKTAVVLRMCLGTSTYATMALREFMREGIKAYKPEFGR